MGPRRMPKNWRQMGNGEIGKIAPGSIYLASVKGEEQLSRVSFEFKLSEK